jgi:N-acetylglucosaminyldiphosphoundecaprenol N-acetyl-beta-D-mannosaminyltransferase
MNKEFESAGQPAGVLRMHKNVTRLPSAGLQLIQDKAWDNYSDVDGAESEQNALATWIVGPRSRAPVIGIPIDVLSWEQAIDRIQAWARHNESRYVCLCNVHSVITATQDPEFQLCIQNADMATPDGAPVAWMLRRLGFAGQKRINGPDLMWHYCEKAAYTEEPIFLYGSDETTLAALKKCLTEAFPGLHIADSYAPPFRPLTPAEDTQIIERINASGAGVVWVSLGCPKQEKWMAEHRGKINAVMIGVGAAFSFHAGLTQRAPLWMQRCGLEWLHRLACEPGRLWKRYLVTNTLFLYRALKQLLLL